jgi:hypothetical protein
MPVSQLLADLFLAHLVIREESGRLMVGPGNRLTPELTEAIKAHRDTILSYLVGCPHGHGHLDGLGRCRACPYRCCRDCGRDTDDPAQAHCPACRDDADVLPAPPPPAPETAPSPVRGVPFARVPCAIEDTELEGDYADADGYPVLVEGVCATCSRCGHETESYGTSDRSVRRCLALMREECPEGQSNYYVAEEDDC